MKPVLGKHIYIFNVFTSINSETVFGFAYLWDIKQQQLLALILSDQDRTSHKQIYFYYEQTQRKNVEKIKFKESQELGQNQKPMEFLYHLLMR